MRISLTAWIIIAVILGALAGLFAPGIVPYFSIFGDIFKFGLMMLIMPLVLTSMVCGVAAVGDIRKMGRLGGSALGYYFSTTFIAVFLGLLLVNALQPGVQDPGESINNAIAAYPLAKQPTAQDVHGLVSSLPLNEADQQLVLSQVQQAQKRSQASSSQEIVAVVRAKIGALQLSRDLNKARGEENTAKAKRKVAAIAERPTGWGDFARAQVKTILTNPFSALANGNVLAVIFFALLLGGALTTLGERGQKALELFRALNEAVMKLVSLVMYTAPIGVFALLADSIARGGVSALRLLFAYAMVVTAGLLLHGLVVLPTLLAVFGRRNPLKYAAAARPALAIAFSTSSSAATLPISLDVAKNRAGVDDRVGSFVLPLGATINMDGTALYEAVAAIFIAQVYGITLGPVEQIIIFVTAALAAIGAAAIPSAGTVTMAMVLTAVGLPLEGIGLILAVDRLLDMVRTTVNVWGDLIGTAVVEKISKVGKEP